MNNLVNVVVPAPVAAPVAILVHRVMTETPFMKHLGVIVDDMHIGRLRTRMGLRPEFLQQHGFAHAGVLASLADHTAGSCAGTHGSIEKGTNVLSIEFKINMLAPAKAEALLCQATTLRIGSRIAVVESEVFCTAMATHWNLVTREMMCAKATITLSVR